MNKVRFRFLRDRFPTIMEDASIKDSDPWWKFTTFVSQFNEKRQRYIAASIYKCMDESMSPFSTRHKNAGRERISLGLGNHIEAPRVMCHKRQVPGEGGAKPDIRPIDAT